jgi:hypothetical protein
MRWPSHVQHTPAPTAQPCEAAHEARPMRERGPSGGDRRRASEKCDLAPELAAIGTTMIFTIPIDSCYARTPSPLLVFASGRSPTLVHTPAQRWPAPDSHAGHCGGSKAHQRGRRSPRHGHKARGSGSEAEDEVAWPPNNGDQPARVAPAFL